MLAAGEDPGGDHEAAHYCGADHGAPAADELREVADYAAADAGTDFHPDACSAGGRVVEALCLPHEGCVAVLRGVTGFVSYLSGLWAGGLTCRS